jgi:hypothetical protein
VAHFRYLFQMAAPLLNLVYLLIVEQNSKNSLKKIAPNGLVTHEMLIRNSFGAVTSGAERGGS